MAAPEGAPGPLAAPEALMEAFKDYLMEKLEKLTEDLVAQHEGVLEELRIEKERTESLLSEREVFRSMLAERPTCPPATPASGSGVVLQNLGDDKDVHEDSGVTVPETSKPMATPPRCLSPEKSYTTQIQARRSPAMESVDDPYTSGRRSPSKGSNAAIGFHKVGSDFIRMDRRHSTKDLMDAITRRGLHAEYKAEYDEDDEVDGTRADSLHAYRQHQIFQHGRELSRKNSIISDLDDVAVSNIMQAGEMFKRKLRVGDMLVDANTCQQLVMHPNSRIRLAWDLTGFVFIIYDVIAIPLYVFDLPETDFTFALTWISTCWWTLDIFMSFITGYHTDGFLEMRPWRIARRYARSWMCPDGFLVLMDWALLMIGVGDAAGILRIRRTARVLRIIRAVRLVRLIKVTEILAKITDGINSEFLLIVVSIVKLVISVVILNHYIACAWYLISTFAGEDECTWIRKYDVLGKSVGYMYTTSLHWSMTQFMPASMEVNPCNLRERSFTIAVLVFGLVTFSSFVSSITTVMAQLANISKDRTKAEHNLRQYLNENRVSVDLGIRIRRYFRENYEARRKRVHELDISFFGSLPENLKVELRREIYMPVLTLHPLLCRYAVVDNTGMWLVCHMAMSQQSWLPGQTVFLRGELAIEMLFVLSGELDYFLRRASSIHLEMDQWLCEGALWSKTWHYCGRLVATSTTELYGVSATKFRAITGERWPSFRYLQMYASRFMATVREAQESAIPLTDICEDIDALVDLAQSVFEDVSSTEVSPSNSGALPKISSDSMERVSNAFSDWGSGIAASHMNEKRLPQRVNAAEVDDNNSNRWHP